MNKATAVRNILIAIVVSAALCLLAASISIKARAQSLCGSYQAIIFALEKAGERQVSIGVVSGGRNVMLIYASPKTHSWTLVITREGGLACLVAAGSDYDAQAASDPS